MLSILPASLTLLLAVQQTTAWPSLPSWTSSSWRKMFSLEPSAPHYVMEKRGILEKRANKTVWVLTEVYQGENFFDKFDFFNYSDPTNGLVDYVDRETAMGSLAYITEDGRANMHVDNWTWLTVDEVASHRRLRPSVRIHSKRLYNGGLFLLDVAVAPYGCGTWPAFWTTGFNWPADGEIDIIEGVHASTSNQVAFHTNPGCILTSPGNFTGTAGHTNCDASVNFNVGCGIVDQSIASFGETFNEKGGGIYAMKWDEQSIDVWFFYRSAIPDDILDGLPDPSKWRLPSASLSNVGCEISRYFSNQMIIFDTTLCGDWAGTSYNAAGCPGTCVERVANPTNFDNATWSINYVKVYEKKRIDDSFLVADAVQIRSWSPAVVIGVMIGCYLMI